MRTILDAAYDMTLDRLATLTDRVADSPIPSVSALSSPPAASDTALARVELRLDQLVDVAATLKFYRRPDRRSRPRSCSRRASSRNLPPILLAVHRPHPLVSVGITETSETVPDDAPALAPGRKTHGPVTDGGG